MRIIAVVLVIFSENIFIVKENEDKIWSAVSLLGISAVDSCIGNGSLDDWGGLLSFFLCGWFF